jgi:bacillithiol system protein YtxJ
MGLFSKTPKPEPLPWLEITSTNQLNELLYGIANASAENNEIKPILLFKHSTRCSISSMALNGFERKWTTGRELCDIYFIDLLKYRDVSDLVAELTGVQHQSPQVIVIKGKEIVYDASHSSIDARQIESILSKS